MTIHLRHEEDDSLHLFVVLSRSYKTLMDYARKDIKQHGLNSTEFAVMELLYHKGPQPIQQIGQRILLASGSLTYVVDQLSKKGWLIRRSCTKDRRITYVELTESGRLYIEEIFPKHQEAIQQALCDLTPEEKKILIVLLKKLGLYVEKYDC